MNWGPIPDGDNLYRQSVFPPSFRGRRTFRPEKLWRLLDKGNNAIVTSIAWERYVPTVNYVHAYGCRLGLKRNEKNLAETKGKDRQVYCGAYQLKARVVRELGGTVGLDEILSADIIHHIENDEIAHANLIVFLNPGISDVEGTKTAIIDRLWNATSGPLIHICDCDQDIAASHPSTLLLPGPAGAYHDTRSYFSRLWYRIRFVTHDWFWRKFCRK